MKKVLQVMKDAMNETSERAVLPGEEQTHLPMDRKTNLVPSRDHAPAPAGMEHIEPGCPSDSELNQDRDHGAPVRIPTKPY